MEPIIPKDCVGEQYSPDVALIFKPSEILLSKKQNINKLTLLKQKLTEKFFLMTNSS